MKYRSIAMNEQEEAAFVDSFFLPDGILEEEEEEVNEQPSSSLWSGAPPENPWANEVPLQTSWNTPQQQEEPSLLQMSMRATEIMPLSSNNNLGSHGIIGNASYESNEFVSRPLHGSDWMRETLQARLGVASSVPPVTATPSDLMHLGYPFRSEPPSYSMPENGPKSQTLPFRPPPGFTQTHTPPIRIQEDTTPTEHDDDNDDSIRSDSSVPLELYDREFLSTSSLSGSSSVDETQSSWTPNTSSVVDETPIATNGSKQHLNDRVKLEPQTKQVSNTLKKENDGERNSNTAEEQTTTKTVNQESKDANISPKPPPSPPTSPVTKSRNRRGHKARRNKQNNNNNATENKSTSQHTASQQQQNPSLLENAHAALDWTAGLMEHMLGVIQSGISRVLLIFKSTSSFWKSLLIICVGVFFEMIRLVGVLVSFCVLIFQSAIEEATQEWRIFSYFCIMNYTPHLTKELMETVVLPHWIPHVISCAVVCGLCRGRKQGTATSSSQDDAQAIPTSHRISQIILRQVRLNLPIVFFIEGFSHEMGTAMALEGSGRLVVAYMILILRLGLLFSPMALLCGAIQVLMACYMYWIPFMDVCILLIGLASVRYAKFLEQCNQAARDIRANEKD